MRILDLFSGIGGFSVAGHALGWETAAFVERDRFCQAVLRSRFGAELVGDLENNADGVCEQAAHTPTGIPIYDDITTFSGGAFRGRCDIVTAGFPCQPFSAAGQRRGDTDDRFLWPETVRIVSEARPEWCVFENVAGLLSMVESDTLSELEIEALQLFHEDIDTPVTKTVERIHRRIIGRIIGDLEAIGYSPLRMPDGTPVILCLPACAVGAWHRRDRLWIVAYDERSTRHGHPANHKAVRSLSLRGIKSNGSICDAPNTDGGGSEESGLQQPNVFTESNSDAPDNHIRERSGNDIGSEPAFTVVELGDREPFTDTPTGRREKLGGKPASAADAGECGEPTSTDSDNAGIGAPGRGTDAFRPPEGVERQFALGQPDGHDLDASNGSVVGFVGSLASSRRELARGESDGIPITGIGGGYFAFDHWLEAAGELCRVVHGLPEELDAADVQTLEQAVKCLGREEAERAVGFDLGEIENRVWRTERLKALGNTIYPEVVLQVFGVIERLRTSDI